MKNVTPKVKNRKLYYSLVAFCFSLLAIYGCQDDEVKSSADKTSVKGHVQKGPFIIGTTINISELSSALDQTGNTFSTQTTDNSGFFELDEISLTSNFIECAANGFYFDEVKGSISLAPLNLHSLSDITDSASINVNIMTHLEQPRVKYLVGKQKSFADAKKIAQSEVLGMFGFAGSNLERSELLDISSNSEGNAMLLAVSVILQGNRSVGDLSELLATISNGIKEDGVLHSDTIISNLRTSAKNLSLPDIRSNLEKRYQDLNVEATIPDFEKYIYHFLEISGIAPVVQSSQSSDIETNRVTLGAVVNANSLATTVTFEYGTTTEYGQTTTASSVSGIGDNDVSAIVSNLSPGTVYHWRVVAVNSKGTAKGNDMTFTTLGQVPSVSALQATGIETRSATIGASVNANSLDTNLSIEYGTTTNYGKVAPGGSVSGAEGHSISVSIPDLLPGITYHWRIVAVNSLGTTTSQDMTFTTLGLSPTASTRPATEIISSGFVMNGTVNANYLSTNVVFEYGTTTQYGQTINAAPVTVEGAVNTSVIARITGLTLGVTYHFRIKASNDLGESVGADFVATPAFIIGSKELGGMVAYILRPEDAGYVAGEVHGLIVSTENQTKNYTQNVGGVIYEGVPWYNGTYLVTGATATAVGSGLANTTAIINAQGNSGVYCAKLCRDYNGGGYNDWYMPSKDELAKLYQSRSILRMTGNYWSSTEADIQGACYQDFNSTLDFCGFWKYNILPVRAVRSF